MSDNGTTSVLEAVEAETVVDTVDAGGGILVDVVEAPKPRPKPGTAGKTNAAKPAPKPGGAKPKAAVAPKAKAPAKPAAKKLATPKAAKPKAAPAAKSAAGETPKKKDGLRKPQIKVLEVLAKHDPTPLTRAEISARGKLDLAGLTGYIGPVDPEKRKYNDETYFPTLVTLGLVRHLIEETETGAKTITHRITAKGKSVLEKIKKAGG